MERRIGSTRLAPAGLFIEHAEIDADCVFLDARATAISAACPCCGASSRRIQSRYLRQASDLPIAGRRVVLRLTVRRFWCDAVLCRRRIFAERFGDNVLAPLSRRTGRLETIVHHLGLALGGRPAAAFADRLMMPVSNDTLLRVVRRRTEQPRDKLAIIGIDDFAFRRGQRYGTIVCNLERRKPVILLPDREQATSQAWLLDHPSIRTVARDRGGGYSEAIAKALPHADQVADRWHLMENASRAFLDAVGKSMRQIRRAVGSTIIDPKLLTYAERLQYEGYQRRQETNEAILDFSKQGIPIKQIVTRTGHSRKLVRSVLRGQRSDVFRARQSSLEAWLPWLDSWWEQGARNASALWRDMREKGFRGQIGVVSEWARRRRLAEKTDQSALARTPSARSIARFMTLARDDLSKSDAVLIAAIENNIPDLVTARTLIDDFQQMIRSKAVAKLDAWLERAKTSLVASFANGVEKDVAAVRNAIISPWSNGQTEGQITKLKLIKRHVWTASALQVESSVKSHRRVQSCVRPFCVAHMATGPDVIRGSGPNQMSAVCAASAWNGFS